MLSCSPSLAGRGKDNPANMSDVVHPDCELVIPESIPTEAPSGEPTR